MLRQRPITVYFRQPSGKLRLEDITGEQLSKFFSEGRVTKALKGKFIIELTGRN